MNKTSEQLIIISKYYYRNGYDIPHHDRVGERSNFERFSLDGTPLQHDRRVVLNVSTMDQLVLRTFLCDDFLRRWHDFLQEYDVRILSEERFVNQSM